LRKRGETGLGTISIAVIWYYPNIPIEGLFSIWQPSRLVTHALKHKHMHPYDQEMFHKLSTEKTKPHTAIINV